MDDVENGARYPPKPYYLNRQKLPLYSQPITNRYEYEEEEEEEEFDEGNDQNDLESDEVEIDDNYPNGHRRSVQENDDFERYLKKRKLKNPVSGYEFAPRVEASGVKLSFGDRKLAADWTEHEIFVLLEVWGDRFLQLGRKSLRSEDWLEVAEKVSEVLKIGKTETQCRRMMDGLKRKYKKEKLKVEQMGLSSKWVYFKKMDMLMGSSLRQERGLACGVDSGEFVFMDMRVYLNRANGFDEMQDSPSNSEIEEDEHDGVSPRRAKFGGEHNEGSSFRLLADSVQKFGKIYEKIESSKRQQMMELEKMRMDFHKELELQKKQILERAQAEIAKIREGDDEDSDDSAENLSE